MKFIDLDKFAKEKVREWYRESCEDDIRHDLKEKFQEMLESNGFSDMKIYWSLGHCQGDGVAFEGNLDVGEYLAINDSNIKMRDIDMANPEYDPYQLPLTDKIRLVWKHPEFEPILGGEKYREAFDNDNEMWGKISHFGHYYHEKSMEVICDINNDDPNVIELCNEIEARISEHVINLSIDMRNEGYDIIDSYYDISDEYLNELLDGDEFDEDGNWLRCA